MPQAVSINTRFPSIVVVALAGGRPDDDHLAESPIALGAACQDAATTHAAMTALSVSVADLSPEDPRHATAHGAAALLQPRWQEQIERAVRLPAEGPHGFRLKASLVATLVERDPGDTVVGPPALRIAASLADDLLAYEWARGS